MKKNVLNITITLALIFSLVGCNSNSELTSKVSKTNCSVNSIETTEAKKHESQTYSIFGSYNEGLAWVQYGESDKYWGCIDKKGKMLFQYNYNDFKEVNLSIPPFFENGYAYLASSKGSQIYVIDKSGDVVHTFDNPVAYGYGYTVVENHYSDFESAYYEYVIYNPDRQQVHTYKSEEDSKLTVKYCGDGVFYFEENSENVYLFFAKKDKWVKYNFIRTNVDQDINFHNGLAFTVNNSYAFERTYVLIDSEGNISEIEALDKQANFYEKYEMFGAKRENNYVYGNSIIFYDEEKPKLSSYNVKSDSFYDFKDRKTIEKFETHYDGSFNHVDINPSFNNNGFLVSLVGADGFGYVLILDYNMNMQTEPIQSDSFEAYDNGTCSIDTAIYDMKGNKLYSLSDKGYEKVISDSDDTVFVCSYQSDISIDKDYYNNNGKKCNFAALDKSGNVMFDKIDTSNVTTKSLDFELN